jgi:hypothetical protein
VNLTWTAVTGATGYTTWRKLPSEATFTQIGTVTSGSTLLYDDTTAQVAVTYNYAVRATHALGSTPNGVIDNGWRNTTGPTSVVATDGAFSDKVRLTWVAPAAATGFKVFRTAPGGVQEQIATIASATTLVYDDTTAVPSTAYSYRVSSDGITWLYSNETSIGVYFDFLLGDGAVLNTAGDDEELAGMELYTLVPELHHEAAAVDEEELVFMLVKVPVKGTLKLDELELLAVEVSSDAGRPVLREGGEGLGEVGLHHRERIAERDERIGMTRGPRQKRTRAVLVSTALVVGVWGYNGWRISRRRPCGRHHRPCGGRRHRGRRR